MARLQCVGAERVKAETPAGLLQQGRREATRVENTAVVAKGREGGGGDRGAGSRTSALGCERMGRKRTKWTLTQKLPV